MHVQAMKVEIEQLVRMKRPLTMEDLCNLRRDVRHRTCDRSSGNLGLSCSHSFSCCDVNTCDVVITLRVITVCKRPHIIAQELRAHGIVEQLPNSALGKESSTSVLG